VTSVTVFLPLIFTFTSTLGTVGVFSKSKRGMKRKSRTIPSTSAKRVKSAPVVNSGDEQEPVESVVEPVELEEGAGAMSMEVETSDQPQGAANVH
jgi:hypothetical protein